MASTSSRHLCAADWPGACTEAAARGLRRPTVAVYFDVIGAIEQKLRMGA
jgi:hypothetical protein